MLKVKNEFVFIFSSKTDQTLDVTLHHVSSKCSKEKWIGELYVCKQYFH